MNKDRLARLLVLSDMHAFGTAKNAADSVLDFCDTTPGKSNPLLDLISLGERGRIKADVVICAGDICNRADGSGLRRAWDQLHKLRDAVSAVELVATCGNHDLDSRYLSGEPDPDPKGALLALQPRFPFGDQAQSDKFWARNYAVTKLPGEIVLVNLNTSAFHGGEQSEIDHGRVGKRTIQAIAKEVADLPSASAHILLCHHHPLPLSGWGGRDDTEFMKNGQELIDAIVQEDDSQWLIIHGHRHLPLLMQAAAASATAPFVLGSASLGARVPGVPNQFHLVDLYTSEKPEHAALVGTVETWSWSDSMKWQIANNSDGLPPLCGFGYRGQLSSLAASIHSLVNGAFLSWEQVLQAFPGVQLLLPQDMKRLEQKLEDLGLSILRRSDGMLMQVGH
jgi:hypothetical protein